MNVNRRSVLRTIVAVHLLAAGALIALDFGWKMMPHVEAASAWPQPVLVGEDHLGGWRDEDGAMRLYGVDGEMLTGWQQVRDRWYYLDEEGALVTSRWIDAGGSSYYVGADGAMLYAERGPDGSWLTASGERDLESGPVALGGSVSWLDAAGIDRGEYLAFLEEHKGDYLGTPYNSSPCSLPGEGMHCTGFIARALFDMGLSDRFDNGEYGRLYFGGENRYNAGALFKEERSPYDNDNTWHTRGFIIWAAANDIRWVAYETHEDAVAGASRGEYRKGDIMLYASKPEVAQMTEVEHAALFWGDERGWKVWESAPERNAISQRSYYGGNIIVLTSADI